MNIKLSSDFLSQMSSFSKFEEKKIRETIETMSNGLQSNSLKAHKIDRTNCDPSFWSARVNDDLRIIFSKQSEAIFLLYVDHHDDAYNWAEGKSLDKNKMGSVYIYDNNPKFSETLISEHTRSEQSIFSGTELKLKHLLEFGIKKEHAEVILRLNDEEALLNYIYFLPSEVQEALIDIIAGTRTLQDIINDLRIDNDSSFADDMNSKRRFIDLTDLNEYNLDELLENYESWKVFLHPKQQQLVRMNFLGPSLIEGGPGTGKTIVGIHRALHLAENIYPNSKNIYYVTYNKNLTYVVKQLIESLNKAKKKNAKINVINVDSLFYKLLVANNFKLREYNEYEVRDFIKSYYCGYQELASFDFFVTEYFEVIQKYQIKNLVDYLDIERLKRSKPLSKNMRKKVWPFFEGVNNFKKANSIFDFDDRANLLIELVENGKIDPFIDSIILDEAQDLSLTKIVALSKLIKSKKNNLFMLSDQNQRIYSLTSWKKETGLRVGGRSYYLTLNYRTTKEIKKYAELEFDENTTKENYVKEYKSILSGPEPVIKEFGDMKSCYEYLIDIIKKQLNKYEDFEIAVISDEDKISKIQGVFEMNEVKSVNFKEINNYNDLKKGVNLLPIKLSKGLEYKVIIMFLIPELNPEIKDLDEESEYYYFEKSQQYECLKYVAKTRARDYLYVITLE